MENKQAYKSNIWKMQAYMFLRAMMLIGGVLVPFFTDWGGITLSKAMILQAIFLAAVFAFEIPTGVIADKFGRKYSIMISSLILVAGALVYSSAPNFYIFALGEIIWAIGVTFSSGADDSLVYDSLKKIKKEKESKKIFARLNSFELAGMMVAAPIGSAIAYYIGLRETMMFMVVPFFLSFLVACTLKEPEISVKRRRKKYIQLLKGGISYFKNHRVLRILAFDGISIAVLVFPIVWLYQPKLQELNFPLIYFGIVQAALIGGEIIVLNKLGFFEKFTGKKNYLFFTAMLSGICLILLAIVPNIYLAIPIILLIAAFGLTRPVLFANYYNKHIASHNRATVLSTISMTDRLFRGIVDLLIAFLLIWSLTIALIVLGSLVLVFAVFSRVEEEHLID